MSVSSTKYGPTLLEDIVGLKNRTYLSAGATDPKEIYLFTICNRVFMLVLLLHA